MSPNVVMRAFILRRERIIRQGDTAVTIIAPRRSAQSIHLQRFLSRNRHPYLLTHPEVESEAAPQLADLGLTVDDTPVVLCGDDRPLLRPSPRDLGDRLGIAEPPHPEHVADVVVVGAGLPASRQRSTRLQRVSTRSFWRQTHQA